MVHPYHSKIEEINKEFTGNGRLESAWTQNREDKLYITVGKRGVGVNIHINHDKKDTEESFVRKYRAFLEEAERRINSKLKTA